MVFGRVCLGLEAPISLALAGLYDVRIAPCYDSHWCDGEVVAERALAGSAACIVCAVGVCM